MQKVSEHLGEGGQQLARVGAAVQLEEAVDQAVLRGSVLVLVQDAAEKLALSEYDLGLGESAADVTSGGALARLLLLEKLRLDFGIRVKRRRLFALLRLKPRE